MKKSILFSILIIITFSLHAQKDTGNVIITLPHKDISRSVNNVNVSIYPVPVKGNSFTIKTDKDISSVNIINIIGQDVFKVKYSTPLQLTKIILDDPKRGMYLVSIIFIDGTRVVKKIMFEEIE